jgi:hypothetical protein
MKWIIDKAFYNKKYMFISNNKATWYRQYNSLKLTKDELFDCIKFLIDNIFISVSDVIFKQVIGIPMGTDYAPFLANLYVYALEFEFLDKLTKTNIVQARKFSNCFRYIDDLITFNNNELMDEYKYEIYPSALILNKENITNQQCSFLDIDIKINNNRIITNLYDKRDDFNFNVNTFAILSGNIHYKNSHGILISQLLRYAKVCCNLNFFINRAKLLIHKLTNQFFNHNLLIRKFNHFYDKYQHCISHYSNINRHNLINKIFNI